MAKKAKQTKTGKKKSGKGKFVVLGLLLLAVAGGALVLPGMLNGDPITVSDSTGTQTKTVTEHVTTTAVPLDESSRNPFS